MISPLIILAGGLAALGLAVASKKPPASSRDIWLINGKRYAIAHRIVGPGWDASLYPGFCNFSTPVITGQIGNATEVQFEADWCAQNTLFTAPDNMAITEK